MSVLFADLVGFTSLSEHRDPEAVRELLSVYFDRCRSLIGRYGGTVEKFIGDAVMAVWGSPVAREDDPVRAVRAALGLTAMVAALGGEAGMPELRVRAGVLTGSAAVEIGAEGEGSSNIEFAAGPTVAQAIALRALGRDTEALRAALPVATGPPEITNEDRREAYLEAGLAAVALDDEAAVKRLIAFVADLPPVMRSPLLRAGAERFAGLLAKRQDDTKTAEEHLEAATRALRAIDAPFVLAQVLLENAELLHADGRDEAAAPLLSEATEIFTRLRATPYLQRAQAIGAGAVA